MPIILASGRMKEKNWVSVRPVRAIYQNLDSKKNKIGPGKMA